MEIDNIIELPFKNSKNLLSVFENRKYKSDNINFKTLALEKISELKYLGLKKIELEGINSKIVYEMASQLHKHIKHYGLYIDWFGRTDILYDIYYSGILEHNVCQCMINDGFSEEIARKIAITNTPKPFISEGHNFFYHPEIDLYYKEGSITINAISINPSKAISHSEILQTLKKEVERGYHPPHKDYLEFAMSHEFGHNLSFFLDDYGMLNPQMGKFLRDSFDTRAIELYKYETTFEEFVAEAFAESYHSPNPRKIAKLVRAWIDEANFKFKRSKRNKKSIVLSLT